MTRSIRNSILLFACMLFFSCEQPQTSFPGNQDTAIAAKLLTGTTQPSSSQGTNGDLYINTASSTLYVKISGSWSLVADLKGQTGPAGSAWLSGTSSPSPTYGVTGDYYLNTANFDVYQKVNSSWLYIFNMRGPAGAGGTNGQDGLDGNTWITGFSLPDSTIGTDGDLYFDTTTTYVYKKTAGSWQQIAVLQGPQGVPAYSANLRFVLGFSDAGNDFGLKRIAFNGTSYVAITPSSLSTSSDGVTWTYPVSSGTMGTQLQEIAYGNGVFVISTLDSPYLYYSHDGISWTAATGCTTYCYSVRFINNAFIAVGSSTMIWTSDDGISWQGSAIQTFGREIHDAVYSFGKYIAVGDNNTVISSSDLMSWTGPILPQTNVPSFLRVEYGNGIIVAISNAQRFFASNDGLIWEPIVIPAIINDVAFGDDHFVAVGNHGTVLVSSDGLHWKCETWGDYTLRDVIWDGTEFNITIY